ncbi:MAG: glycoside hydrolase, partial [Mucilaginibacter sp.]|nr:glycoside hydrolase [Mucilaginibacter sp.]
MKTRILTTTLLVLCSFVVCFAAITGLNGKWSGSVKINAEDELNLVYNFKVDGEKLSGTVQSPDGDLPIADGVLSGNEFAFTVKAGKYTVLHTGKYYGDSVVVAADVAGKSLRATLKRD